MAANVQTLMQGVKDALQTYAIGGGQVAPLLLGELVHEAVIVNDSLAEATFNLIKAQLQSHKKNGLLKITIEADVYMNQARLILLGHRAGALRAK